MKIAIVGTGNVGGVLGTRWAHKGHQVTFGTRRRANELKDLLSQAGSNAKIADVREAVRDSDIVLLAIPWSAVEQTATIEADFTNKILIDATNPLLPDLSGLAVPGNQSGAEMLAQWAPRARVVKALNTVGNNVMADATFSQGRAAMFYCGDDATAKRTVAGLIEELGFEALDAGPLTQAGVLEMFALLWISLAVKYGYGREIAFQFMQRAKQPKL